MSQQGRRRLRPTSPVERARGARQGLGAAGHEGIDEARDIGQVEDPVAVQISNRFAGECILLKIKVDRWEEINSLTGIPIRRPLICRIVQRCFIWC